jgi:hypothetical protein
VGSHAGFTVGWGARDAIAAAKAAGGVTVEVGHTSHGAFTASFRIHFTGGKLFDVRICGTSLQLDFTYNKISLDTMR